MKTRSILLTMFAIALFALPILLRNSFSTKTEIPPGRSEVVFWHFWGGEDRDVVDDVVLRFNNSQSEYFVRAIAMPGNNLQAKLFLAVAGGDPPDLVNQDDPVLADWGQRGVIHSMQEIAPFDEVQSVRDWMLDSAERLSVCDNRMFGVCNGLDIRALYYNKTWLEEFNLEPPKTFADLDKISETIAPAKETGKRETFGYLPDSRRLWAWGYVCGADFYSEQSGVEVDTLPVETALNWMAGYAKRYGPDDIAAFRKGDQSLPGKTFPLLPVEDSKQIGRYAVVMDGQWRVRNITAFQDRRREAGLPFPEFGVCSLPVPGPTTPTNQPRENAGWVNGNFFVVPRGAKNTKGAWEFAKFWIGYADSAQAAKTCADGGWIPVSKSVTDSEQFRTYLKTDPLFAKFVDLAASPNQFPIPQVVGAAMFRRTVEGAAYEAMNAPNKPVKEILTAADQRIQEQLDRFKNLRGSQ
ncbi:MAG: extracellular solute-binding protein [Mariniblastus sp.]